MRRVLFLCSTYERAKDKFNRAIQTYNASLTAYRISYSSMTIHFDDVIYEFKSVEPNLEVKLRGMSYDNVIIDESAKLNTDQETFLRVIMRETTPNNPVAWWNPIKDTVSADPVHRHNLDCKPLYTSQLQLKPLTDEEIMNIWVHETKVESSTTAFVISFARAIEAAHGIKGDSNE